MEKWKKGLLVSLGVVVAVLALGAISCWSSLGILVGTGDLSGAKEPIPAVTGTEPEPVSRGEADWPCWRGQNGDGRSAVTGIIEDWSDGLKKLWQVDFLCQGSSAATWSAPVIQGNRLVVCGRDERNDLVFCLDPANGELLWQASYTAKAGTSHGAGPRATPCIDGNRVYTFGRGGDLACWNLLDGKSLWRRNVGDEGGDAPRWGHSSSPLVAGRLVVVQGGGSARTIAYDKMTGEVAWKTGRGVAGYAALVSMELGGEATILAFHGTGLAALDAKTGDELWNIPWQTSYDVNATTPVVSDDMVFISSGYGSGSALLKVSRTGAETVWRNEAIASHHSDPHLIDGHLYGYSGQSHQNKGAFKCVELRTGKEKWATNGMGWGTCAFADGHLICCDIKGNLYLLKPQPQAFMKVTELPEALGDVKGPVWTIPVVANGRLYLRFKQRLVCYELVRR